MKTDIEKNDDFKSFKYKAKLMGKNYGILKNATIAVPLKYSSNFRRSLEMTLLNCKVELKLKWTKYSVLSVAGNENDINHKGSGNNNIFTIKGTKLCVPVITLSARYNKNLSKLLSKGSKRSVYWNEHKAKSNHKNTTSKYRYYLESNFVGFNRLFVLVE